MRGLGAFLLAAGFCLIGVCWCAENRRRLRLGREFYRQLYSMERWIFAEKRPITEFAEQMMGQGGAASMFWGTLQEELHQSNAVDRSWNMALQQLGSPYQEIFTDQGQQLLLGDAGALELLKNCRKELFQYLEKERTSAREKEKLALVLGLSAGLMCALILL